MNTQPDHGSKHERGCAAVGRVIAFVFGLALVGTGIMLVVASLQPSGPGGMVPNYGDLLAPVLTAAGVVIGGFGVLVVVIAALAGRR